MGKRSNYKRRRRDAYDTPLSACAPLCRVLAPGVRFVDPCGGCGLLIDGLRQAGGLHCAGAMDVFPRRADVRWGDALAGGDLRRLAARAEVIVTNPPWHRPLLHSMITRFIAHRPTWLLFDANWMHTGQAAPFMPHLHSVISVGRVKWIKGTRHGGMDDSCWYGFGPASPNLPAFIGPEVKG